MPARQTVFNERLPVGLEGRRVTSEEWNGVTGLVDGESAVRVAMPVQVGTTGPNSIAPFTSGNFVGITELDINAILTDDTYYADMSNVPVMTFGGIWGVAGEAITAADGDSVFYDPADGKYYTATDTGRVELTTASFRSDAAADGLVRVNLK